MYAVDKSIHLMFGVIKRKGSAYGPWYLVVIHNRLGAVMAGSHSNAHLIEQGTDIIGVNRIDIE